MACYVFERRRSGARVWWSLRDIHKHLAVSGPPSRWYGRHWGSWESHLQKCMGLRRPRLRRAKETARAAERADTLRTEDFVLERILQEPSASTWALLALATKWAISGKGGSTEAHADAWRNIVVGVLDTWFLPCTPCRFRYYFGSCEVHMGYSTTGSAEVVFFVGTDGTVEWDRDASAGGSLWIAFLRATSEFTGRASLAAPTLVIRRGGLALQPLMKQWLNQLCMVIEGAIASH